MLNSHKTDIPKKHTCIVGIGNTLRSDDAAGAFVCRMMEEKKIAGLHIIFTQQLDIGLAEELSKFSIVVFVDASTAHKNVSFNPIDLTESSQRTFTHQINASTLAGLIDKLYKSETKFYTCAVGGFNFDMGSELTGEAYANAQEAVLLLTNFLAKQSL